MNTITVHGKTYKLPQNPVWHEGPPPAIGWWPAWLDFQPPNVEQLRFFNGKAWSIFFHPHATSDKLGQITQNYWQIEEVRWTDQWWK